MITITNQSDQDIVARTLWAEARSQGILGMVAVACVIQNRAKNPGWWGHDLRGVCLARMQFSCWNQNDPQFSSIRADRIIDSAFPKAEIISDILFHNAIADITKGADHYRAEYAHPVWAVGKTPTFTCGNPGAHHLFYKIGLTG